MARLIDADAFFKRVEEEYDTYGDDYDALQILGDIDDAPTVNAVPVSYILKWIENHPTDYTTVESMLTDWREGGVSDVRTKVD